MIQYALVPSWRFQHLPHDRLKPIAERTRLQPEHETLPDAASRALTDLNETEQRKRTLRRFP